MDKKILGFLWAMLGVVVGIVCLVGIVHCGGYSKDHEPADVVRDTVIDTIPYYKPVPKDSLVLTYKTVTLPKSDKAQPSIRADTQPAESCTQNDAADVRDSTEVTIPIIQKMYKSSDYTAWVSGYEPTLDSIRVYSHREIMTVTNRLRDKPRRISLNLNVGYGITPKGTQPYIGFGVGYRLLSL